MGVLQSYFSCIDVMSFTHAQDVLRISFVTETYPPEVNGVANTLLHYVEGLTALGHEVEIIRPKQEEAHQSRIQEDLVHGFALPFYSSLQFGVASRRKVGKILDRFSPDLVYIATEGPLGYSALRAANSRGVPVISGFHTNFDEYCKSYRFTYLSSLVKRYLRHFHNKCSVTLVPSLDVHEKLKCHGFSRLRVTARGIDADVFSPQQRSEDLRQEWSLAQDQLAVIYVGRISAEKNMNLLVKAFRRMEAQRPGIRLILVGDGPERNSLEKQHPDFIFCGTRIGSDLARHYASADIFLFPSITDTFGNVVLEAMASGLVVCGYDYAAPALLIDSDKSGFLAVFGDEAAFIQAAVAAVTQDPLKLEEIGNRARDVAEKHHWSGVIKRLESLIRRQIRKRRYYENSELAERAGNSGLHLL